MKANIEKLGKVAVTVEKDYWSNTKDYDKLTIVEKEGAFGTYISRKPVPAGKPLTDRNYWIPFSSVKEDIVIAFNEVIEKINSIESTIDEKEAELYEAINSISVNGITLAQGFGYSTTVGISQKALTEELNRTGDKINKLSVDLDDKVDKSELEELIKDIPTSSTQADYGETDSTSPAYIKNKPDLTVKADKSYVNTQLSEKASKTEVESALENKANKNELDIIYSDSAPDRALIKLKTNTTALVLTQHQDISNLITSEQLQTALAPKANNENVYSKSETYNKEEVDNLIDDTLHVGPDDGIVGLNDISSSDVLLKKEQILSTIEQNQVKTNIGIPQQIYSKTEVDDKISTISNNIDGIFHSTDTKNIIDTYPEIVAFFNNVKNDTTLDAITGALNTKINNVENKLDDYVLLEPNTPTQSINSGLDLGGGLTAQGVWVTSGDVDSNGDPINYEVFNEGNLPLTVTNGKIYYGTGSDNELATKADVVASGTFNAELYYTKTAADGRYAQKTNVYDKTAADTRFALKSEIPTVPDNLTGDYLPATAEEASGVTTYKVEDNINFSGGNINFDYHGRVTIEDANSPLVVRSAPDENNPLVQSVSIGRSYIDFAKPTNSADSHILEISRNVDDFEFTMPTAAARLYRSVLTAPGTRYQLWDSGTLSVSASGVTVNGTLYSFLSSDGNYLKSEPSESVQDINSSLDVSGQIMATNFVVNKGEEDSDGNPIYYNVFDGSNLPLKVDTGNKVYVGTIAADNEIATKADLSSAGGGIQSESIAKAEIITESAYSALGTLEEGMEYNIV